MVCMADKISTRRWLRFTYEAVSFGSRQPNSLDFVALPFTMPVLR